MADNCKNETINILGTQYEILFQTEKENPKMEGNDGICEPYSHKIVLDLSAEQDKFTADRIEDYYSKVFRHEVIHAFFFEAGLESYSKDELLVEWLAKMLPKINQSMAEVDGQIINKQLERRNK